MYYALFYGERFLPDTAGEFEVKRKKPVKFMANVSPAYGIAVSEIFGSDIRYDKVILTDDVDLPIDESSVLFIDKDPMENDDGEFLYDYIINRIARTENFIAIAASKVDIS